MFCREQAVQLHREREAIRAKGAELAFIGNGNRHFASGFKEQFGIEAPLYVDPKLGSYRALAFRRSLPSLLSLRVLPAALRALRGGARQGAMQGDGLQLGGVLVVRQGGEIAYRYASESAGDHAPVSEILAAL